MAFHNQKVVFVTDYPLDARDAKRFGLTELQAAGLQIEVWDLSHFYFPAASGLGIESPSWMNLTVCSSMKQVRGLCSALTIDHVVIFLGGLHPEQVGRGRKLLRSVSETPARLASFSSGHIPVAILPVRKLSWRGSRAARVLRLMADRHRWKKIPQGLSASLFVLKVDLQRRMHLRGPIRPLDHIWVGTMVTGIAPVFIDASTTITYIHTLDYDLVLATRAAGDTSIPRLVFIDSMGPLHPDYVVHENGSGISIEAYSDIICRGLNEVEHQLGSEVVIAAHPRATPGVMEPWYGGRTLFYSQTPELIADATAVVVADGSTAIGLAAVFQKPLALLISAHFDPFIRKLSLGYSQALSTPLVDLDYSEMPIISLDVDEDAYARYVEKYIKKPGTPEKPFWSIVASEIMTWAGPSPSPARSHE